MVKICKYFTIIIVYTSTVIKGYYTYIYHDDKYINFNAYKHTINYEDIILLVCRFLDVMVLERRSFQNCRRLIID
jgi:hypothetical protein